MGGGYLGVCLVSGEPRLPVFKADAGYGLEQSGISEPW